MLDLQTGDHLLDLCSGPGGKALIAMQTLKLQRIVCNDVQSSRIKRVANVMKSHLYDKFNDGMGQKIVEYSVRDGRKCPNVFEQKFDKVLCDVPCYTDRHVIFEDENNIFKPHRARERLDMPQLQSQLLR